jgi:hypothetical protein
MRKCGISRDHPDEVLARRCARKTVNRSKSYCVQRIVTYMTTSVAPAEPRLLLRTLPTNRSTAKHKRTVALRIEGGWPRGHSHENRVRRNPSVFTRGTEAKTSSTNISERTISRWMRRAPKDPEPTKRWLAFLRNHREAIAAMDFFTVPNHQTDWRRAVNANRWLSLVCETPLPDPASEKYKQIARPAVGLRQTLDVCPCDIRAFWAAKSSFWAERHREREKARLAGGEDWIRTRSCVSPDNRAFIGRQSAYSACLSQTESPNQESGS